MSSGGPGTGLPPTEQSECPRCTEWKRLGLSDTCPDCDAIAESDGPALKCQYPMITTVDRSKDGNCTVKAVKHPDGTFEVIKVEFQGNPCPTCHGTGVVTNHGWSDDPTGEAKPVRPCPTCHGEKP